MGSTLGSESLSTLVVYTLITSYYVPLSPWLLLTQTTCIFQEQTHETFSL